MKFRLRAFSYHLIISLLIASLSMLLVFGIWYESPLAKASGVGHIFAILVTIDVIIGPLMTLFIATEQKPKQLLKQDLIIIGFIQLSALFYGLYTIAIGRPAFIVFDTHRFQLVAVNELNDEPNMDYSKFPISLLGAPIVAVKEPTNEEERSKRLFNELQSGISPATQRHLYEDYDNKQQKRALSWTRSTTELKKFNSSKDLEVLVQYPEGTRFLPMLSPEVDMTVLINSKGEIIKIVDLRPWE